jgi:hypothetical protein
MLRNQGSKFSVKSVVVDTNFLAANGIGKIIVSIVREIRTERIASAWMGDMPRLVLKILAANLRRAQTEMRLYLLHSLEQSFILRSCRFHGYASCRLFDRR